MVKNDEFRDIPSLGPARDAMDQPPIPTLKPMTEPAPMVVNERPGNGMVYVVMMLLLIAVAGFGFWSYQQTLQLERTLSSALALSAQLQNRVLDLEHLISTTDENASKSDAALAGQVKQVVQQDAARKKEVDVEIAKLWTVAYQRNKPKLEQLDRSLESLAESLSTRLNEQERQLSEQLRRVSEQGQQLQSIQTSQASVDQQLLALNQQHENSVQQHKDSVARQAEAMSAQNRQWQALQEQVAQVTDSVTKQQTGLAEQRASLLAQKQRVSESQLALEQSVATLKNALENLRRRPPLPDQLARQISDHQKELESINAFRLEVNQRVYRLGERVNNVQLTVEKELTGGGKAQ